MTQLIKYTCKRNKDLLGNYTSSDLDVGERERGNEERDREMKDDLHVSGLNN